MNNNLQNVGKSGETIALHYLTSNRFTIIEKNFRSRYGEIDIIAKKGNTYHFVEVKTRTSTAKGKPYESVGYYKKQHLMRAVQFFLLKNKLQQYKLCIDVISIILGSDGCSETIDYFENIGEI